MRHLSADRLAALASESPTTEEQAHLASCAACAAERDAHRRIVAGAAAERQRPVAPISDWNAIAAQLRKDGIIRAADDDAPARIAGGGEVVPLPFSRPAPVATAQPAARRRAVPAWAMRAAAAVALVAGGAAAGRLTTGTPATPADPTSVAVAPADSGPGGNFSTVANGGAVPQRFGSAAEAQLAMAAAERTYQAALEFLATQDTTLKLRTKEPVDVYRARLAAFDEAVAATRRALSVAPTDPVMNSYYLSSVSAREATLRQIDDALPVGERVTRF